MADRQKKNRFRFCQYGETADVHSCYKSAFFEAGHMIRHITGFRFLKLIKENGQAKGVLINELQRIGFPIFLLPPSSLRQAD